MNLKHSLLMLTATVSLFGATVTTASAATIQALPNQEATRAAHDAVEGSNDSQTATTTQSTDNSSTVVDNDGETATTSQTKAVVN